MIFKPHAQRCTPLTATIASLLFLPAAVAQAQASFVVAADLGKVTVSGTSAADINLSEAMDLSGFMKHLKSDGRLARYFLKGVQDNAMNALLCGAGHNLRKILNNLRLLCAHLGITLRALLTSVHLPIQHLRLPIA